MGCEHPSTFRGAASYTSGIVMLEMGGGDVKLAYTSRKENEDRLAGERMEVDKSVVVADTTYEPDGEVGEKGKER